MKALPCEALLKKMRCVGFIFLLNFSFLLTIGAFFAYSFSFVLTDGAFAYSGKVHLIRALGDCKQRNVTVSKKAPTVSKKASPVIFGHVIQRYLRMNSCNVMGVATASEMFT